MTQPPCHNAAPDATPTRAQPDRAPLCRFWLAGLVYALQNSAPMDLHFPLNPLVAYLWRWTFAAVPKPLRATLATAIYAARSDLDARINAAKAQRTIRGIDDVTQEMHHLGLGTMAASALVRVMESDDVFRIWRRTAEGAAVVAPASTLDAQAAAELATVTQCAPRPPAGPLASLCGAL